MSNQSPSQLHLLRTIASCTDQEEAESLIFQNPCLLSSRIQMELGKAVELLPQEEHAELERTLERLQSVRVALEKGDPPYPVGDGPLERIWQQLSDGVISQTYATQLARELGATDQLSLVYIRAMRSWISSMVDTEQWRLALIRHSILMVAVESMPPGDEARIAYWRIGLRWIQVVMFTLYHYGDYRIYRNAMSVGEKIIEQAHALQDQKTEGEILHRLGILCLDPYHGNRTKTGYEHQIDAWRRALEREAPEVRFIPREEWWMPEPIDALRTAEQYLRRAVEVRQGHEKGLSLKALVDTLHCRYRFLNDKSVDVQELRSLAKQALTTLDQVRYLDYWVAVLAILMSFERSIEQTYLDQLEQWLSEKHLSDYATATTDIQAFNLLKQGIQILGRDRPRSALAFLRNGRSIVDRLASADEEDLVSFLVAEIQLVIRAYIGDMNAPSPESDIMEEAKKILGNSSEDPRVMSAKLLHLAFFVSVSRDQEDKGVVLLDWIEQLSPDLVDEHKQAFTWVRFILLYNHAAWAVNAGQPDRSAIGYIRSLTPLLELSLTTRLLECLAKLENLVSRYPDQRVALVLVKEFQPIALALEHALGEPATLIMQRMYKAALSAMPVLWPADAEVAHTLIQMAKGARFAAVNQEYGPPMVPHDELSRTLLAQIQETEKIFPEDDEAETENGIDDLLNGLLLTAYGQDQERYSGSSSAQRLSNLRRSYDTYLNQTLLGQSAGKSQPFPLPPLSLLSGQLDQHTVLVNCYIGQSPDGEEVMSYLVACTHEKVFAVGIPMGMKNRLRQLKYNDRKLLVHPLSLEVSLLRENLNLDGTPVAKKVAATLEAHLKALFGSFVGILEELKAAGKNHLCIVPHGPLHYYPFHLLGANGKTLADDWVVTYLPNLNLLISNPGRMDLKVGEKVYTFFPDLDLLTSGQQAVRAKQRQRQAHILTSIGLSFEHINPFHLDVLPQSITEASSMASIFGETPILEQDATKKRVFEALEHSRYVHLSTHGRHCVEAPAFQCVYLAGDETSDGRLFAYELLSLNLHNLELLTLSACETTLGRFDFGDNLRGIPASLLLRGVTTIVGTLWEISPEPAEHFFTLLYRELQGGKNRLDAFAAAQRGVRSTYPRYVDWGAFYFIGDWRDWR